MATRNFRPNSRADQLAVADRASAAASRFRPTPPETPRRLRKRMEIRSRQARCRSNNSRTCHVDGFIAIVCNCLGRSHDVGNANAPIVGQRTIMGRVHQAAEAPEYRDASVKQIAFDSFYGHRFVKSGDWRKPTFEMSARVTGPRNSNLRPACHFTQNASKTLPILAAPDQPSLYQDRRLAAIPIRTPMPRATATATSGRCSVSLAI